MSVYLISTNGDVTNISKDIEASKTPKILLPTKQNINNSTTTSLQEAPSFIEQWVRNKRVLNC